MKCQVERWGTDASMLLVGLLFPMSVKNILVLIPFTLLKLEIRSKKKKCCVCLEQSGDKTRMDLNKTDRKKVKSETQDKQEAASCQW